jgi:hypothetical protein
MLTGEIRSQIDTTSRIDTERLGRIAGGNRDRAIRRRLHDDDRLPAQGRVFLLLVRRKEGVEIEEQPLTGFSATVDTFIICSIRVQQLTSPARAAALRLSPRGSALLPPGPRELSRVRA